MSASGPEVPLVSTSGIVKILVTEVLEQPDGKNTYW